MNLGLAMSGTHAGRMLLLGLIFVGLKLLATVIQLALLRGDYRHMPTTIFYRVVYMAGKITPSLAAACFCVASILRKAWVDSWIFGTLALGAFFLAWNVVRLRKLGRFFGLLDLVSKRHN